MKLWKDLYKTQVKYISIGLKIGIMAGLLKYNLWGWLWGRSERFLRRWFRGLAHYRKRFNNYFTYQTIY
jgi:hypothetical protein